MSTVEREKRETETEGTRGDVARRKPRVVERLGELGAAEGDGT